MTVIDNLSLAELYNLMTENKLPKLMNMNYYINTITNTAQIFHLTVQRMKHILRGMNQKQKQELLYIYCDWRNKMCLYKHEVKTNISYENYCLQLRLVKMPYEILKPYLPDKVVKRMDKMIRINARQTARFEKFKKITDKKMKKSKNPVKK